MKPVYWILIAVFVAAVVVVLFFVFKKKKTDEEITEETLDISADDNVCECSKTLPSEDESVTFEENNPIPVDPLQSRTTDEYVKWQTEQHEQEQQADTKTE